MPTKAIKAKLGARWILPWDGPTRADEGPRTSPVLARILSGASTSCWWTRWTVTR